MKIKRKRKSDEVKDVEDEAIERSVEDERKRKSDKEMRCRDVAVAYSCFAIS